jgi:hypothetical protein
MVKRLKHWLISHFCGELVWLLLLTLVIIFH